MLKTEDSVFVLVDVQIKLASVMNEKERLLKNVVILLKGMLAMDVPVIWIEQIPEKMGETIPVLKELLDGHKPITKTCFNCTKESAFMEKLEATGRRNVIISGIESHVCVYQTAAALAEKGYNVEVVSDAVASRTVENAELGCEKTVGAGAELTSVEMVLFELLGDAKHPAFKDILKLVK